MSENTNEVPLASSYLATAIKEMNEKDGEGIVAKIKMHIKLVSTNSKEIAKLQKSNDDLMKEIGKLTSMNGLKAEDFLS